MTYFFLGLGILALLFPKAFNYLAWADQQTDTILKKDKTEYEEPKHHEIVLIRILGVVIIVICVLILIFV